MAGETTLTLRRDGSYLIPGGLRGLGPVVARWMAERGAGGLILMGRREPTTEVRAVLDEIERGGTRVEVVLGDVTRRDDVKRAVGVASASLPELRGVVHLAGVLDDGLLVQQDWSRFASVMATKAEGAWHLHDLTRDAPLDHFVLFSSGVGMVGASGQGNHSAANAFLDAFAHARRRAGHPALAINWGAWAEVGAAAERVVASSGEVRTFSVRQGLHALEWAMARSLEASDVPDPATDQVAVLAVDWEALLRAGSGRLAPLYGVIEESLTRSSGGTDSRGDTDDETGPRLVRELDGTTPARRRAVLVERVRIHAAAVLGLSDPSRLDPRRSLQEFGLDSLMAVELRNRLGLAVGRALPATLIFEYPSVLRLSEYLANEVLELKVDAGSSRPSGSWRREERSSTEDELDAMSTEDELDAMSTEDVAARLMRKLRDIEAASTGSSRDPAEERGESR